MAYFVKIGAVPSNWSGVGSRGFQIYRRGRCVVTVWGSIEVRPGRQFFWAYTTQYKWFSCGSLKAAIQKRAELIALRADVRGYSRLPAGIRIRRHAKSSGKPPTGIVASA